MFVLCEFLDCIKKGAETPTPAVRSRLWASGLGEFVS